MSAEKADINTLIGKVITRSHAIEKLLRTHYKVAGHGLHKAIDALSDTLPAVLVRTIRIVAIARNAAAHPDGFEANDIPADFERLCDEIEILIPHFASQRNAQPAESPKQPKPPAAKPHPATATTKPIDPIKASPKQPRPPWTPAELKQLTDGFEAKATVPELAKALNRGIGAVQQRLIKLGKLAKDQYKTYPPDAQ